MNQNMIYYSLSELISDEFQKKGLQSKLIQDFLNPQIGVQLPNYLKVQKRILEAQKNKSKFAFFPNRFVTVPVFNKLKKLVMKTLMYGKAGISKTSALISYTYLSKIINDYQFQSGDIIAKDIPRLFYLSYSDEDLKLQNIKNQLENKLCHLIKNQLPLSLQQKYDNQIDLQVLYRKIRQQFRKKGNQFIISIDQFNTWIEKVRQFNKTIPLRKEYKDWDKKTTIKMSYWFRKAVDFSNERIIFNSSQAIQEQIISKPISSLKLNNFYYNLNHHQKITTLQIYHTKSQQTILGKKEILKNIFFVLKRISKNKEEITLINSAENKIFTNKKENQLFEKGKILPNTHYKIRQYLSQNYDL